jgi:hypothetical protein
MPLLESDALDQIHALLEARRNDPSVSPLETVQAIELVMRATQEEYDFDESDPPPPLDSDLERALEVMLEAQFKRAHPHRSKEPFLRLVDVDRPMVGGRIHGEKSIEPPKP